MKAARKFSPNFCAVVVPWRRHGPPLNGKPDPSGDPLLSTVPLPLPVFSASLLPIFSTLLFSPLCRLNAQGIPFLSTGKAEFLPQCIFWPIAPCSAHH